MDTAKQNSTEAKEATRYLVEALLLKKKWSSLKHGHHFTGTASSHKKKRKEIQEERQAAIKERYVARLPSDEKKACENAMSMNTHYFLVLLPYSAQDTYLTPEQFRDMVAIRYGKEPINMPADCTCQRSDGRREPYTLEHALVCENGGNIIGRHNMVVRELHHIAATATGGSEYSVEPEVWLRQPCEDNRKGLKSDIQVRGLENGGKVTQIDVRVCYPNAQSYQRIPTKTVLRNAEIDKKRSYEQHCRSLGHQFVPFILSTDGAIGEEAGKLIGKLSKAISTKWKMPESVVKTWIRHRLSIAQGKACSACIRGSRAKGIRVGGPPGRGIGGLYAGSRWNRQLPPSPTELRGPIPPPPWPYC